MSSETDYPRTVTLPSGIEVDEGVADVVSTCLSLGLTPRASCSGLNHDHAPDATPQQQAYLAIQAAPTHDNLYSDELGSFPEAHKTDELVKQLLSVGERSGFHVERSTPFMLYPCVVFRLCPSLSMLAGEMFSKETGELTDDEREAVEARKEDEEETVNTLRDGEIRGRWAELEVLLEEEFRNETLPVFDDEQELFDIVAEELEGIPGLEPGQRTQFFK
jgi:hypothetical protein